MSRLVKCDRCGKYLDYSQAYEGRVKRFIETTNPALKLDKSFDLCSDCVKSFAEWLKSNWAFGSHRKEYE